MADLIPPLVVGVQLDASQLNAGVNAAKGGLNGLGTSAVAQQGPLGSLTKTLGALGIAFGAYQIFQFGKGLLDAAEAAQLLRNTVWAASEHDPLVRVAAALGRVPEHLTDLATTS